MHLMPQEPLPGAPTFIDEIPPPYQRYTVAGTRSSFTACKEGYLLTQQAQEAHYHITFYHLFLQTGGRFTIKPDSGNSSVLCILRGMIQTEPGIPTVHTLTAGSYQWLPPVKDASYSIYLPKGNHIFCALSIPNEHQPEWATVPQHLPLAIKQMLRQLLQKQPHASLSVLLPMLAKLFCTRGNTTPLSVPQQAAIPNQLKIHRIREYLLTNLTDSLSIRQLSLLFTINEYQLKKDFKSVFGTSIHNFIIRQRISRAGELLLKGELSIEEIACATGFYDRSHFSKKFKSATGHTPSGYLKHVQNEPQYNKKTA